MSGHTPGPWFVSPRRSWCVSFGDDFGIAECWMGEGRDNGEANARLVSASPELLESVKALLAASDPTLPKEWRRERPVSLAKAAIAKAEGK